MILRVNTKFRVVIASWLLIILAHLIGVFEGLYVSVWWYDIPLHLFGGAWVALLFFYIAEDYWKIFSSSAGSRKQFLMVVCLTLGFVMLVGVFWEFYEYLFDVFIAGKHPFAYAQQGLADTMGDLFNDFVGGSIVVFTRKLFQFRRVSITM
ncbi:MAG: hypothetical protein AAB652_00905 [Patescibacteria group bacterium]